MLKGISPLISPELLKVLCEMGHGDEIVLADANFPAESMGQRVVRADGIGAAELLCAILPLFPLDQYDESNFVLMSVVPGDPIEPVILAEFLLEKDYEVHGIVRRASISNTARIDHLIEKKAIHLHDGDLSDSSGLIRLVGEIKPDEIYNLAAQSHVQVSFDAPEYSGDVDALGVLRVLEAVRVCGLTKSCKVYQASTSELYGKVEEVPQRETTPFHPYSPYAVAKQYGFWMVKEYRDAYGMFAVNGILFNHESERRGENFVTRKITLAVGRIAEGMQDHLELGNMDSLRDWGYAKDYVECMWLIMQQEKPDDFVIATGVQHTVRDFTEKAFAANGISIRWEGKGIDEKGYDAATGKMLVCVNPQWFRPTDVDNLWGDPTKAKTVLGWNPQKTSYEQLVEIMAKHDRMLAKREKAMRTAL